MTDDRTTKPPGGDGMRDPFLNDGDVRVYLGDCIEVMAAADRLINKGLVETELRSGGETHYRLVAK